MAQQHRVIHIIHAIIRLEGHELIRTLYVHFLHREPGPHELQHYLRRLNSANKHAIIGEVMCSSEAEALYKQPHASLIPDPHESAASLIRHFYPSDPLFFIHALYNEILGRNPDPDGLGLHLKAVHKGVPRRRMLLEFFNSAECKHLLTLLHIPHINEYHKTKTVLASGGHRVVHHIGIFLGYPHPLALEGEGIGRFLYRLTEGFLSSHSHIHIHIATTEYNYINSEHSFSALRARFPGRIHITNSNNMEWINNHVPAEVWIVPIVSLELAMFLNKPYILCLHDMVHHQFKELYFSMHSDFCYRVDRNAYSLMNQASAIVSNSQYVRANHAIGFAKMPVEKTHVIRMAPPVNEYQSFPPIDEGTFRQKYNLYYPYIVFPTVLRLHKNFERLIAAFIRFRQTHDGYHSGLHLVFTDQLHHNPKRAEVAALLQQAPVVRNSILFVGRIPTSDLPSLYKYAVGTIVPTLFEGSCPFPILESLTMDTPVAAANIEVSNEIITDMSAFLAFNPYSIEEMEASIRALWTHRQHLLHPQKAALSGAMQRTWNDAAREYYALIQQVAE
ncbi:DUF4214 domain-containing protein [Paenibacillus sp. ACRRX]|uniref:DUF4214 domain-containing protein n=1 Tax=Paenibacillus sp. ACRRX TaxID=2918206 RepID=UPI001EF5E145|nr:DUF4214 domain-containing protein [Paenibacillus sp. ACRRX]MCG7409896.1 DUF4214 domain-containing protein [Paenibacillus sp. ACRRX]